ncbi:uncharacterized protein LOC109704367 [Ananas comosus]|uniref:Uncharacterized protein LOC109704367 n=1 Tax=Ananas comosus TaxID=4615 RepID=A0A6P5EC32_ANACO|nr:uncharacterized protein LOC109704367 [Ananas comosus]
MSPRRYTCRLVLAPPSEVPEQAGPPEVPESARPSEVQELRAQVTALAGQFGRLQELMERQMAAAAPTTTGGRDPPALSVRVPEAAEGEGIAAVPVAPRPPPASVLPAASGSATPDAAVEKVERERSLTALIRFKKFNPPIFEGEKMEPSMVESWINSMETLFKDLYTVEKDEVYLAAHCLEKSAKVWWKRVKRDQPSDFLPMLWEEFKRVMFANYFPDTLTTFVEVFDRALWAEHGNAHVQEERELMAESRNKGKKRPGGGSGGQSGFKKPPKHPRAQSEGREVQRCVICSGDHRATRCEQRQGRCYECGQAGHIARGCPRKALPAPSVASAPATPGPYGGAPPTAVSAGRAMVPRQPEPTRSAPSSRVFAAQVEEPAEVEARDVMVGMV